METIHRKRGGFPTHSDFLQTSPDNKNARLWINVCSTHQLLLQSREKGILKNRFYIRSIRGHKQLGKQRIPNNFNGGHQRIHLKQKIRKLTSKLGLRELIKYRNRFIGKATARANKKRQTIDGICVSQGITISQGGYLSYHFDQKSDNILLWIKTPHLVVFGDKNPPLRLPSSRSLRLHPPRGKKTYIYI